MYSFSGIVKNRWKTILRFNNGYGYNNFLWLGHGVLWPLLIWDEFFFFRNLQQTFVKKTTSMMLLLILQKMTIKISPTTNFLVSICAHWFQKKILRLVLRIAPKYIWNGKLDYPYSSKKKNLQSILNTSKLYLRSFNHQDWEFSI